MSKKILCDFPSQTNSRKPRKNTPKVRERNTKHIFLHFSLLIITLLGVLGIESGLGRDWIARQTTHTNGPMLKSRSFFLFIFGIAKISWISSLFDWAFHDQLLLFSLSLSIINGWKGHKCLFFLFLRRARVSWSCILPLTYHKGWKICF